MGFARGIKFFHGTPIVNNFITNEYMARPYRESYLYQIRTGQLQKIQIFLQNPRRGNGGWKLNLYATWHSRHQKNGIANSTAYAESSTVLLSHCHKAEANHGISTPLTASNMKEMTSMKTDTAHAPWQQII